MGGLRDRLQGSLQPAASYIISLALALEEKTKHHRKEICCLPDQDKTPSLLTNCMKMTAYNQNSKDTGQHWNRVMGALLLFHINGGVLDVHWNTCNRHAQLQTMLSYLWWILEKLNSSKKQTAIHKNRGLRSWTLKQQQEMNGTSRKLLISTHKLRTKGLFGSFPSS